MTSLLAYLPRGNTLQDRAWQKRHRFLQGVLLLHVPGLLLFGQVVGKSVTDLLWAAGVPAACLVAGRLVRQRRLASFFITAGLVWCSAALVGLSSGSIEAHFHFFIMIGFIALYQDWVPFLWNITFTVLSHGLGSALRTDLIFNHPSGQTSPWVWSAIHGISVLAACCGVVIFWETTEKEQRKSLNLTQKLADAEINRRRFTSELLVNLARRNQSLLYRQLGLINQLEEQEKDPDALADLFQLDHLATRIRRNAESLLVLSGEEPPRTWGRPVALVDVVRAAIAETEDLDRVVFAVDERLAVLGTAVADLTHLVAELVENAVHFSPPEASVIIRTRPYLQTPGAHMLTVEDWGLGMRSDELTAANELLAAPQEVDLSVSQRLGLHVVARLAQRHGIQVSLSPTPGCGVTAAVVLPPSLFSDQEAELEEAFADAGIVPAALSASTASAAVPATDLPSPPDRRAPADPPAGRRAPRDRRVPADPPPAERWIDLTDPPAAAAAARAGAPGPAAAGPPDWPGGDGGDGLDWAGWWEPAPGDPGGEEMLSPLAARPPLSERVQATPAAPPPRPAGDGRRPGPGDPAPVAAAENGPGHPAPVAVGEPGTDGVLLSRRVPQSHLAPELRRNGPRAGAPRSEDPLPDAADARAALSRYQASRQAARALVEEDDAGPGDPGPERPPSNGGWT